MKINYRILLINFVIVALILGSSAIAFYSIMYNVLSSQQSKYLLNSANDFIYTFQNMQQDADDEFHVVASGGVDKVFDNIQFNIKNLDFIFDTKDNSSDYILRKVYKETVSFPSTIQTIDEFKKNNPLAIIQSAQLSDGHTYYYGRIISNDFLNTLSNKINADVALVLNNSVLVVSNESINLKYLFSLNEAYKKLASKNNFDVFSQSAESSDILATIYKPTTAFYKAENYRFIIFTSLSEAADLRNSLKYLLIIIGSVGIVLSLILTLIFTDKLRKQITQLNDATKITKEGNFQNKIKVHSTDELGSLASAFNIMLDELQKHEKAKNEYSEFITMLNQNPTLAEISNAALHKIIITCGFTIGALYVVEDDKVKLTSSYGIGKEISFKNKPDIFETVIKNHDTIEINSKENLPIVSTGVLELEIKNILILPIVYNNKVVAVLELGSFDKPTPDAREYLSKIKEQLAIGLTNALAFVQLANLVTELKKLNEDYQKQNIQIRKQNEALIELHNQLKEKAAELEVQKLKAEEAAKLKSHFLASMSHELRTPMNSILGLSELILEDRNLPIKNRERIEVVLKSGKRLMNLINDILDLSKIEAGKMIIHDEEVMLEDLVKEVENSITPLAIQKELPFKIIRNVNTNIIINTDKGKVVQVLINLLGNAVKFTNSGFVELHIYSLEEKVLKFEVIDSGIGISEKDQEIIFEEFRQIDETTTRKYTGSGLGLAISKKIADLMKGSLTVKSEIGDGSIFTFSIPLKIIKMREAIEKTKVDIKTLLKNRKNPILIIDDDQEVRYTIGQYLIANGYEIAYASDGDEGIKKAKKLQPFAITLDVMMPGKDGWTVLKELKESPSTKDIPVILISILGDKNIGYGLGAFEYFVKPIASEKLISTFKKLESLAKKKLEKIVIVDDDELEFEKFKDAFKDEKIRIEYIKDSELAFSKILEVQPDLIVLDLLMPNIDGISLSYKLKSNKETNHIPIIISTGKEITEEEKNSLTNIVEEIAVKSHGHPMDVLKIVRDRIKIQESYSIEQSEIGNIQIDIADGEQSIVISRNKIYQGEVLIVDDDPDSLFTLKEIVEACECKTILAKNGIECLKTLEFKIPDLILLDIMMPEMDGFQVLHRIRQNERWAHIPVYAITAKAMLEDKEVILRHGFNDYVAKPINSGVLAFKIERLFTKQKIIK
ncbi:MAG: response regulator [Bacteroidetes bacterium]|nr:response regulator [Bacteroidota bacterium]